MHVGFLQALYGAPRLEKAKLTEARNLASLSGKKPTLLTGVDKACKHASEKEVLAAAQQYVQEHFDTKDKNQVRGLAAPEPPDCRTLMFASSTASWLTNSLPLLRRVL